MQGPFGHKHGGRTGRVLAAGHGAGSITARLPRRNACFGMIPGNEYNTINIVDAKKIPGGAGETDEGSRGLYRGYMVRLHGQQQTSQKN